MNDNGMNNVFSYYSARQKIQNTTCKMTKQESETIHIVAYMLNILLLECKYCHRPQVFAWDTALENLNTRA